MADKIPSGLYRRELFVDARDLQSNSTGNEKLSSTEYRQLLTNRGLEKLAENQLSKSFDATVRTRNATYEYGVDFFLGDTITLTDERLGITADSVVTGIQRSVSRGEESVTLTFGHGSPTVFDILRRKAGK